MTDRLQFGTLAYLRLKAVHSCLDLNLLAVASTTDVFWARVTARVPHVP